MRNKILTDAEAKQKNADGHGYFNHYVKVLKKIIKQPKEEQYTLLSNLSKMIEEDNADWLCKSDFDQNYNIWWNIANYKYTDLDINTLIHMLSNEQILKDTSTKVYKEFGDGLKCILVESEILIMIVYSILQVLLDNEEEWLRLQGKITTPRKVRHYKYTGDKNFETGTSADEIPLSESDKALNARIDRYNNLAKKIISEHPSRNRVLPLGNLLKLIKKEYPSIISKGKPFKVKMDGYIDNWITRSTKDLTYEFYQKVFNDHHFRFSLEHGLKSTQEIGLSLSEIELICLYNSLNNEWKNCNEEAMIYGISNVSNSEEYGEIEHFNVAENKENIVKLYECLKTQNWIAADTAESDWVFSLTGMGGPTSNPIVFTSPTQCHYIVKNFIFKNRRLTQADWDLVMKLFRTTNGKITSVKTSTKTPSGSNIIDEYL